MHYNYDCVSFGGWENDSNGNSFEYAMITWSLAYKFVLSLDENPSTKLDLYNTNMHLFISNKLLFEYKKHLETIKFERKFTKLIFNIMTNKSCYLLKSMNEAIEQTQKDLCEWNYGTCWAHKIAKSLDKYVSFMRFLTFLFNQTFYCKVEEELIRLNNFQQIFAYSVNIAEMHLFNALVVCTYLQYVINYFDFNIYKPLVLEKFLLLVITLRLKFTSLSNTQNVSKLFLPYFVYIKDQIEKAETSVNVHKYFFVNLFRIVFICNDSEDEVQIFHELFMFGNRYFEVINQNHHKGIMENFGVIVDSLGKRSHYEGLIYLKLMNCLLENKEIYYKVLQNSKLNTKMTKRMTKIVSDGKLLHKSYRTNFLIIVKRKLCENLFTFIHKITLPIKEYLKIPKKEHYSTFDNFINYFEAKIKKSLQNNTEGSTVDLIAIHSFEAYRKDLKSNLMFESNSSLEDYLKPNNYFYNDDNDGELKALNRMKCYTLMFKGALKVMFSKTDVEVLCPQLLKMNENIKYVEDVNYASYIKKKMLIDDLLNISADNFKLQKYIIIQNIFNYKNEEKSKKLVTTYLNSLIEQISKVNQLEVVSIIKIIEDMLYSQEEEVYNIIKRSAYDPSTLGKVLRNEINSNDFLKHIQTRFPNVARKPDNLKKINDLNAALAIWKVVYQQIKFPELIDNLHRHGSFKTCLCLLEDYINRDMIRQNIKNIENYRDDEIIFKYFKCYSRIEDNEWILENYVMNPAITKKLEGKWKKLELNDFLKSCEKFFVSGDIKEMTTIMKYEIKTEDQRTHTEIHLMKIIFAIFNNIREIYEEKESASASANKRNMLLKNFNLIITKIFLNTSELKKEVYSIASTHKMFYELFLISQSICEFRKKKLQSSYLNDDTTKELMVSLFNSRILSRTQSNLLHLKVRRVLCGLYKLRDLDQLIIKDIMKIYKNQNKTEELEKYLKIYRNNYSNDPTNIEELYLILKTYVYLNNSPEFNDLYPLLDNFPDLARIQINYKFIILEFKAHYLQTYMNEEVIDYINEYLVDSGTNQNFLNKIRGSVYDPRNNYYVIERFYMAEKDCVELCNVLAFKVELEERHYNINLDIYRPIDELKSDKFLDMLLSLVIICVKSEEEKLLFKFLPKALVYMYKFYYTYKSVYDEINKLSCLCREFESLSLKKTNHIVQHLLNAYLLENDNSSKALKDLSIKLLGTFFNQYPAENGYLLSSFLLTQEKESNSKNNFVIVPVNQRKLKFGKDILSKMTPQSQDVITKYKKFQEKMIEIPTLVKSNNTEREINRKIDEMNKYLDKNGDILIPKMNNIKLDTDLLLVKEPKTRIEMKNNKRLCRLMKDDCSNNTNRCISNMPNISIQIDVNEIAGSNISSKSITNMQDQYIKSINRNYEVLKSKDKPVKIEFISASGKKHNFLLKIEKEDMLKEVKAMELFNIVNNIYKFEGLDTSYQMGLKLFSITPISQYVFLIEWVENTQTVANIVEEEYDKNSNSYKTADFLNFDKNAPHKYCDEYYDQVYADVNVMYRHFHNKFSDPNKWYEAKQRYITSSAAWSLAGYLIGLSDRHPQNILIDNQGSAIHIDYGYILNWGRNMPVPEIVDFRFTRNIRRALGVFEENGLFLMICEQSFKAFVKNFSIVYPHFVAFTMNPQMSEVSRDKMTDSIQSIKKTFESFSSCLPYIKQFCYELCIRNKSDKRLRCMYFGWSPWI